MASIWSSVNLTGPLRGAWTVGPGQRHPAGAHLEVDRGGADADQGGPASCRRCRGAALGVEAVAEAQFARNRAWPSLDDCAAESALVVASASLGATDGVHGAGEEQAEHEQDGDRRRVPAAGGQ